MTVVVRVHGTAAFLDECLASILASTHRSLEVLLVADPEDDAARRALDGSGVTARRVRRVRADRARCPLDQAVTEAEGTYLMFVDCDDVLPRDGCAALVACLERSGSDLVVGARRRTPAGRELPPTSPGSLFAARSSRQRIDSRPGALVELAVTGSMFRLGFWRAAGLEMGSWHRAGVAMARAYLAAAAFDVEPGIVYEEHARDVSLPVERQARFDVALAGVRFRALREVAALVRAADPSLLERWLVDVLERLLPPLYLDAVGGRQPYLEALAPLVRELLDQLPPDALTRVPVQPRMAAWVAAHGSLTDVALLADRFADNPHGLRTCCADGAAVVEVPAGLGCAVPESVRRIEAVDRRLRATLGSLVRDGGRLRVDGAAFLEYVVPSRRPEVALVDAQGRRVAFHVEARPDPATNLWAARAWEDRADAGFSAFLDPAALPGRPEGQIEVALEGRTVTLPVAAPGAAAPATPTVGETADVTVDLAELAGPVLRLGGASAGPQSLRLTGPRGATPAVALEIDDGRFRVDLPLVTGLFGEQVALPAGEYTLAAVGRGRRRVRWAPALLDGPPELVSDRLRVTPLTRAGRAAVRVGAPLTPDERSVFDQQRLAARVHAAPGSTTYDRTVLLETFRGRSVGDNPGALARELLARDLDLDLAFVVDDPSVRVPAGTRAVPRLTAEWYALLAGAHAYIGNAGAPYHYRKTPGQFHLQTWHGTPLKRIGEDRGPGDFHTWRHRRRIADQAAGWDAMISPSPYCTAIFRTAFGFDGPFWEHGYPRNDILLTDRGGAVRQRVRAVLGIGPTERVVLYAPTWREYVGVRDAKPLYLDAEALTRALPGSVVLVRGHYNATGRADVFTGHSRIHDVTRYPDIADLYLAADALVTDYSSVMFDFALTDKPVILLTPDLEQYRDVERGFYFDIEQRAPGPMVQTTRDVVDVLRGDDRHAAARAAFRAEFCPFDDGSASARVVDDLLARW